MFVDMFGCYNLELIGNFIEIYWEEVKDVV